MVPVISVNVTHKFASSKCTKFRTEDSAISNLLFKIRHIYMYHHMGCKNVILLHQFISFSVDNLEHS